MDTLYNITWPTLLGCAGGLALALVYAWCEWKYARYRVRRAELREYKRLSAIYGGTARR